MAEKKVYGGTMGPFLYDDATAINDADGDFAGVNYHASVTDGQHWVGTAPTLDEHVVRKGDLGGLFLWTDGGSYIYPNNLTTFKILDNSTFEFLPAGAADSFFKIGGSGAADSPTFRLENGTDGIELFVAGGSNAFLTGTSQGDVGIMWGSGRELYFGIQNDTYLMKMLDDGADNIAVSVPTGNKFVFLGPSGNFGDGAGHGDPQIEFTNRDACGNGAGAILRFMGKNANGTMVRAVQLNGGLIGCTAGGEDSDLDLVFYHDAGSKILAFRTLEMAFFPGNTNTWDLGVAGSRWKSLYLSGTSYSVNVSASGYVTTPSVTTTGNLNLSSNSGTKTMVFDTSGHLTLPSGGRYKGPGTNSAALIHGQSNHYFSFNWTGTQIEFYVDNVHVKTL